jgi:23S rRNA (cytosine1962-C5)-methyltransferase
VRKGYGNSPPFKKERIILKRVILKSGEEVRILRGHPWVYGSGVDRILSGPGPGAVPAELVPGEAADVESSRKSYLGRGFANPRSKILVRIYSPSKEGADRGFFKRRIREALTRRTLPPCRWDMRRESARIVFGEADFLPGLIVDRFTGWAGKDVEAAFPGSVPSFEDAEAALGAPSSWLAVQFLAWGMDLRREEIIAALEEVLASPVAEAGIPGLPSGVAERPASRARELEGLPPREGLIRGGFPSGGIVIFENGFPFLADLQEGQKTGYYLDQKVNRFLAASYAAGGRVLDACSYSGGFSVYAARAGAAAVTAVDVSAKALEALGYNARLNGVEERIRTVEADVFEALRDMERRKEVFDLVILDPPAFAKSRSALEGALRGYKEINIRAMRLLRPGGVLVSCSCSQALGEEHFKRMISEAAADAERRLHQIDFRCQAPDHPVLAGYDESHYLKCGFYRVL